MNMHNTPEILPLISNLPPDSLEEIIGIEYL